MNCVLCGGEIPRYPEYMYVRHDDVIPRWIYDPEPFYCRSSCKRDGETSSEHTERMRDAYLRRTNIAALDDLCWGCIARFCKWLERKQDRRMVKVTIRRTNKPGRITKKELARGRLYDNTEIVELITPGGDPNGWTTICRKAYWRDALTPATALDVAEWAQSRLKVAIKTRRRDI